MTTTAKRTITARTHEDLIDVVPVMLGFHPADSLVMLTFGGRPFHARIDQPTTHDEAIEAGSALMRPCLAHGIEKVALIEYADSSTDYPEIIAVAFRAVGLEVVAVLHTLNRDHGTGKYGEALASRESLAEIIASADQRVDVDSAVPLGSAQILNQLASGEVTDPAGALAGMRDIPTRNAVLEATTMEQAKVYDAAWSRVVKVAPDGTDRANAASVAALFSWLCGHGAVAWVAVNAAREHGGTTLAEIMATCLENAVPPTEWANFTGGVS